MIIDSEADSVLIDFIESPDTIMPEEKALDSSVSDDIMEALSKLTPREEYVIRKRFGFDDGICHTLEWVGRELNVTRERVRQIEAKAKRKLKFSPNIRQYR